MSTTQIAYRYAKALLDYASEKGEAERVFKDVSFIRSVTAQNRELYRMYYSPVVKPYKKLAVLKSVFGNHISESTMKFFELVTEKGRVGYTREIADEYIKLYTESINILEADITTAIELDDNMRTEIKSKLSKQFNKQINLVEKVDKKIIGGYVLRVGDKQDDKSIKAKLLRLKNNFEKNRINA